VAVTAVRDGHGRSLLRAFVVPAATPPPGLGDDLIRLAREHLAAFKVPRTVSLVPSLPRTPTGKLRRHLVRRGAW
jgi:fatty-acyl-CoA synthase/benzoate-CoA ligase/fatty acid CoA ligase FadD22